MNSQENKRKILFVGSLACRSASAHQRLWAIEQAGYEVKVIDKNRFLRGHSHFTTMLGRTGIDFFSSKGEKELERNVLSIAREFKPDLIWLEWPKEYSKHILKELKNLGSTLVSFQDDNPWGDRENDLWMWRKYIGNIPEFDWHFVKRIEDIENIRKNGGQHCILWSHGVYSPLFYSKGDNLEKNYAISFIGTCMDHRPILIEKILESGLPIAVFGSHWSNRTNLPRRYPENFRPPVQGEEYAEVLRSSKISLGLVSHSNRDEWTMRTYEIPSCGAMFLGERTPWHQKYFSEGKNAMLFDSHDECIEKLFVLMKNPFLCERIASEGLSASTKAEIQIEYSMKKSLSKILE